MPRLIASGFPNAGSSTSQQDEITKPRDSPFNVQRPAVILSEPTILGNSLGRGQGGQLWEGDAGEQMIVGHGVDPDTPVLYLSYS